MARASTLNEDGSPKLVIANQFRDRQSMIYDFVRATERLTLRISARQNESDPGDFRVEASEGARGETFLSGWGRTRTEALAAVGTAWRERYAELGLPSFDWDAVRDALESVRALR